MFTNASHYQYHKKGTGENYKYNSCISASHLKKKISTTLYKIQSTNYNKLLTTVPTSVQNPFQNILHVYTFVNNIKSTDVSASAIQRLILISYKLQTIKYREKAVEEWEVWGGGHTISVSCSSN